MKIQVVSDLHLDANRIYDFKIPVKGDILVIAGDLAEYRSVHYWFPFIEWACSQFKTVFWFPGNHEFYRGTMQDTPETYMDDPESLPGNLSWIVNDPVMVFYEWGILTMATLWTDFLGENPMSMLNARMQMNDFQMIRENGRLLTPEDTMKYHYFMRDFFPRNKRDGEVRICVTHHSPTLESTHEKYAGEILNGAFGCTDMKEYLENADVWVHGHMHNSVDYISQEGCRVVNNALGYLWEKNSTTPYTLIDTEDLR